MRIVGINLICVRSNNLSGIGHMAKRYFMEMARLDLSEFHFIIYKQKSVDEAIFCFPLNASYEIVNVPDLDGGAGLAIFEQTLFYFYLKKCDVMWSPNSSSPWFGRRKKIISILDIYPITYKHTYGRLKRYSSWLLYKLNILFSDSIITISEYSKNDLIEFLHVDPEKIKVLYCFIPSNEVELMELDSVSSDISINGECVPLKIPYFLAVSSLQPIKNYEGLIQGFSQFHKRNKDYYLYIVGGKGWNYERIYKLVEDNNLSEYVIFTGYISEHDLNTLYRNCHATVMPSFYEGFGYTPLEGFYRGKICIATNKTSVPEVVGKAGIYVDPYNVDTIAEGLRNSTESLTEFEKHIKEQISKFDGAKTTRELLEFLKN